MKLNKLNLPKFTTFVVEAGATILDSTNEWEKLRFKCKEGLGLVYVNKNGVYTLQGSACTAYDFFIRGKDWKASKTYLEWERPAILEKLITRDGDCCFFCGEALNGDITVEHLLAQVHGGSSEIANLCLAHNKCNTNVGSLPLVEKIKMYFERKA